MRKFIFLVLVSMVVIMLLSYSARLLVIDGPATSDVIVVLAGETDKRPTVGINLLRRGFAKRLILDVPSQAKVFQWDELELANRYIQTLPDATQLSVCPIQGLSTRDEAEDVSQCLKAVSPKKVLLVTSDYHTRRALSTFRRIAPAYDYTVGAVYDAQLFGTEWWRHREWAKTTMYEWMRLAWWELIDRWRQPS